MLFDPTTNDSQSFFHTSPVGFYYLKNLRPDKYPLLNENKV